MRLVLCKKSQDVYPNYRCKYIFFVFARFVVDEKFLKEFECGGLRRGGGIS